MDNNLTSDEIMAAGQQIDERAFRKAAIESATVDEIMREKIRLALRIIQYRESISKAEADLATTKDEGIVEIIKTKKKKLEDSLDSEIFYFEKLSVMMESKNVMEQMAELMGVK